MGVHRPLVRVRVGGSMRAYLRTLVRACLCAWVLLKCPRRPSLYRMRLMTCTVSPPPHITRRYELEMKRQRAIKKAIHLTRQTVAKEVGFGRLLAARAHVEASAR
jgi:hypothetical protein